MSSKKKPQVKESGKISSKEKLQNEFKVRFPFLWLSITVIAVYGQTLTFGLTQLDDSIFITEMASYNKDLSNLVHSFGRGLFHPTKDIYYRPLFSDLMILNYQISGENPKGYHAINILLHLVCTFLVYVLFRKLRVNQLHSFLLALIFAVHPVIAQAVAWIPGRNDTLLALFTLAFLISVINYSQNGKWPALIWQLVFLIAAFFTKETAILAAPVAFILLILIEKTNIFSRRNLFLYASWICGFALYVFARSQATVRNEKLDGGQMITDLIHRTPALIQYPGKFFLPFNLNVFPTVEGTTLIYGLISIGLLFLFLWLSKNKNHRMLIAAGGIFLFFLLPALIVPKTINSEVYEHRMYLPILGLLLLIQQSVLFQNKWKEGRMILSVTAVCIGLGVINFLHQKNFKDPIAFWEAAVEQSPNAAYADMMLGMRIINTDSIRSWALIDKAYHLDSAMKYINYYYGQKLMNEDSLLTSEKYYLKELEINPEFGQPYYPLARIAHFKKNVPKAIEYLERYLAYNPRDPTSNTNLLLFYIDSGQHDRARQHVKKMQSLGLSVPEPILDQLYR